LRRRMTSLLSTTAREGRNEGCAQRVISSVPAVTLLCLLCFIDRTSIGRSQPVLRRVKLTFVGNARLAGVEKDLRLKGTTKHRIVRLLHIIHHVRDSCYDMLQIDGYDIPWV
jgi:hypothetical protein